MTDPQGKRVFLWVSPRSLSTVFEKCFSQMDGPQIWHEPYTSVYFNRVFKEPQTFVKFPQMKSFMRQFVDAAEMVDSVKDQYIGGNLERSEGFTYNYIKEQLEKPIAEGKKFMLIKDMAFGIDGNYDMLPKGNYKHTFLIRHPNRTSLSARKLLAHLYDYDGDLDKFTGIKKGQSPFLSWDMLSVDPCYNLWKYVKKNVDENPVVIDADEFQNNPREILSKYCKAVGLPWDEKYLSWDSSDEYLKYFHGSIEQIVWGKNEGVYKAAFESTKILPSTGKIPSKIPEVCESYASEFREGYKVMSEHRIKPDGK